MAVILMSIAFSKSGPKALKVFQHGFDFAVPRQGYEDYTRREFNARRLEKNKQWALFKARDEETKKILSN